VRALYTYPLGVVRTARPLTQEEFQVEFRKSLFKRAKWSGLWRTTAAALF
jgi:hypothetical protein